MRDPLKHEARISGERAFHCQLFHVGTKPGENHGDDLFEIASNSGCSRSLPLPQ